MNAKTAVEISQARAAHLRLFRTHRMRAFVLLSITLVCGGLVDWSSPLSFRWKLMLWLVAVAALVGLIADVSAAFNHWVAANRKDASKK